MGAFMKHSNKYFDTFLEIWEVYPNNKGKYYAQRCFDKLGFDEIALLKKWVLSQKWGCDPKYIPRLSTAINKKYYLDAIEESSYSKFNKIFDDTLISIQKRGVIGYDPPRELLPAIRAIGGLNAIGLANDFKIKEMRNNFVKYLTDENISLKR